jgi:hypothetical protein
MAGDDPASGVHTIVEMKVTGPTANVGCLGLDIQDGTTHGSMTFTVRPTAVLASDAEYNCTVTIVHNTIAVYDNGTTFSRAAAAGFCKNP